MSSPTAGTPYFMPNSVRLTVPEAFHAGQTFHYPLRSPAKAHLWIIATGPSAQAGSFAAVSLTSLRGAKDQTVILRQGEHPFIKWDTCVAYALAEIITVEHLEARLSKGAARMDLPVSAGCSV